MNLVIMSQNVQGLNNEKVIDIVNNYFRPLLHTLDILYFQEHKLRGANLVALKEAIWSQADFVSHEAEVSNQVGAGCEGIGMWISPKIKHLLAV